ncbi:MAG: DNA primase [Parcubacteria group bacterium]|nr:DNA primase [Parcubacteria group bacterium]
MNDNVQQIKEKLNISDVISGYLRLTKAGVNYKALCPFHNEKTPSFMVSPSRQSWHCFGCGIGGDIFTFVEKIEGIEFIDTLKILAEKAGVELEYGDPKARSEKDHLYEICESAAQFFITSISNANPILDYLRKRGLNNETIDEWRIGYAPDSWDSLLSFLLKKGYRENEIEKAGLIIQAPRLRQGFGGQASSKFQVPKYHDRFRNRLMFPIFDTSGRVVAFSGRTMNEIISSRTESFETGKYINSPETILYSKSRILYGFDRAKTDIRKNDAAILVEGQMDVILPWQDGVRNIIATSGTALTEEQLTIIKRLTGNLIMAFDMDDAGFRATKRGIDLANEQGFNISVLRLESGKDAADFVKDNPGKFQEIIGKSEPIMSYYFKEIFRQFSPDKLEGKKIIALNLLSEIKRMPSAIERSSWIRELGLRLGVSESDLKEEMERLETHETDINDIPSRSVSGPNEPAAKKTRKEILSERLLALLLKKTDSIAETVKVAAFMPTRDFEFLSAFLENNGNFSQIRSAIPADWRSRLDFLYMLGDFELSKANSDFDLGKEVIFITKEIEREHYKESLLKIGNEISRCEANGSNSDSMTNEFQNISKKLYQLNEKEKDKKI